MHSFKELSCLINESFKTTSNKLAGIKFDKVVETKWDETDNVSIITLLDGLQSGYIKTSASMSAILKIGQMICDVSDSHEETVMFFMELVNMYTGRATSNFNMQFSAELVFISPPKIMSDTYCPSEYKHNDTTFYTSDYGIVRIDIAMEKITP